MRATIWNIYLDIYIFYKTQKSQIFCLRDLVDSFYANEHIYSKTIKQCFRCNLFNFCVFN